MSKFFVFDVESVGLHGEAFAVGGVVVARDGTRESEFLFTCPSAVCKGSDDDREWVTKNVAPMPVTHGTPKEIRYAFWEKWLKAKANGALMAADCLWPVEARFVIECINDNPEARKWEGPYPFVEISTMIMAAGYDPLANHPRLEDETPAHHALFDARQSARLLVGAMMAIGMKAPMEDDQWIDRAGGELERILIDGLTHDQSEFVKSAVKRSAQLEEVSASIAEIIRKVKGGAA